MAAYEIRLIEDNLHAGAVFELPGDTNRVIYVAHGSARVGDSGFGADSAWCDGGAARIEAGSEGAALWRYELIRSGAPMAEAAGKSGGSRLKLAAPLTRWPIADALLLRADSVTFPPGGCAYLHTHQGPGIRCLIEGGIRIDTDGHSTSYAPGGAWFEAGSVPVFAQAAADRQSRFIRVMVLPAALQGKSSIAYVNAEDRDKPKSQMYKIYADVPILLA